VVVHTCNPSIGRLGQEDGEFEASLGYIARPSPSLKKRNTEGNGVTAMVMNVSTDGPCSHSNCSPLSTEAQAGLKLSIFLSQPWQNTEQTDPDPYEK
jgi:hypothetical protein